MIDPMMFFSEDSTKAELVNQLKNEVIHRDKLIEKGVDTNKLVLVTGHSLCDSMMFAKYLHDWLKSIGESKGSNFVVMDPVMTSEYENGIEILQFADNKQINIFINNNSKIGYEWFDYIIYIKVPGKECRKRFIMSMIDKSSDIIDEDAYDELIDEFANLTDGLDYSFINMIVDHIMRLAIVNDEKISYKMIRTNVYKMKENHGIENYWS